MKKKLIALLILLMCMLAYIALAPFEPVSFFSIGAFQLVVVVWAVDHLIRKRIRERKKDSQ